MRTTPTRPARRSVLAALALTGLLVLVTGCGDDDDDTATGDDTSEASETTEDAGASLAGATEDAQILDVTIPGGADGEFAYEGDLSGLTAGPVTVNLTNEGTLEHQAMLLRLNDGETVDTFLGAAAADPSGVDALTRVAGFGGPNGVAPGRTVSSTQVLEAGEYVLICVIPDETGVPHAAHGMVMPVTVAEAEDADAPAEPLVEDPQDADIVLVDFGFSADEEMPAGEPVVVANDGGQGHEVAVYRLEDGATLDDVQAALADPAAGPPPMTPTTGLGVIAPGGSAAMTMPDEPGEYVMICFLPDVAGDAAPHFTHGMIAELTLT